MHLSTLPLVAAIALLGLSGAAHAKDRASAWREDLTVARDVFLQLDLRFNTGGNLELAQPLMDALAQSKLGSRPGGIAVLVGYSTFSAGITAVATLRSRSKAILVGAHPGDVADFWAEGGNVLLPNSGIAMHYANGRHQYSDAPLPAGVNEFLPLNIDVRNLEPDVAVDWTWRDYVSGADPAAAAAANGVLRCTG